MKERALPSPTTSTRLSHSQVKCCLVFGLVIAGIFIIAEEERERERENVNVFVCGVGVNWQRQRKKGRG